MVALANPKQKNQKTGDTNPSAFGEWESVRLAATSRRRWKWGLLAGALIATGGVAGAWAGLAGEETRTVAVLTADLPAGHVISADDVTSAETVVAEGLRLLPPATVEGMVLTRPVPAGSPLVAASVADSALWPEPGQAVVAVPVSTIPQDLVEGTTVDLVPTGIAPAEVAEGDGGQDSGTQASSGVVTGLVHRVVADEGDGFSAGQQVVEVVLPRDRAADLSRAVAGGQAQVAVVNPQEQGQARAGTEGEDPE
ncbi:SAF domain-containing protein [Nocardiopsis sp. CT-R113]|uniref:SAF domain-containing protein n=1 Tax=Nocardiopsis codii TaxID=3065942 RepID=A0ABU7K9N0_9ACTN|nr:SAF domain-containing protein [Nocardiopsis sp. CT-R113]MEE2038935.1 SAF domain-containing protein [Nocardiopsis sp. CT-R113]